MEKQILDEEAQKLQDAHLREFQENSSGNHQKYVQIYKDDLLNRIRTEVNECKRKNQLRKVRLLNFIFSADLKSK